MKHSKKLFLVILTLLFIACSSGGDDPSSNSGNGTVDATSITLSATDEIFSSTSSVYFIVKDNLNNFLSYQANITANGQSISNPHIFEVPGVYEITATYGGMTSNSINISIENVSEIILSFDQDNYNTGDSAVYTVKDNFDNVITSASTVSVNGSAVSSNPYIFDAGGSYEFIASYDGLSSNTVTFEVESPSEFSDTSSFSPTGSPTNFTKKVLLEETTGTWCVSCPTGAYYMSQAINSNPNIYGAAFHSGASGYPDPMSIPETDFWHAYYNAFIFPTIWVNGAPEDWNYNISPQITNELAENATVGLALESAIIGGKLDLEINVGFNATPNEQLQLIILLIEGSDTAPNSPQQGSNLGADYVHKYIVREVYSDILGDPIPATHTLSGGIYTRIITGLDFPTNVNASDHDDLSIIAYVKNAYTETWTSGSGDTFVDAPVYDIYNVQKAQLGEVVSFD
jgi:hypothetical protein